VGKMTNNQTSTKLEIFVAYPLIIIIGFYMMASAVVPFLNVNPHIFTAVFTLSGGIPAITLFFKEKFYKIQTH
jgi:hypothetical protein